jgi:predicted dehydrogenase
MRSKFRIGLAGVGPHMTEHLLPALRLIPGVEVIAAVSSSPTKQKELEQKLWIVKWFTNIESLLYANICDGIVASGSVDYHEKVLADCIESNLPAFIEKPPASNLMTLSRLARAAQQKEIVIGVGLNLPHTEVIRHVEKFVKDTRTYIRKIKIYYHTNKPKTPLWECCSLMESFLLAIVVHPLSLARHFLGDHFDLSHVGIQTSGDAIGLHIQLEGEGCRAEIICSNNRLRHICDFEFELGSGVRLRANGLTSLMGSESGRTITIWNPSPLSLSLNSNGFLKELNDFVENVITQKRCNQLYEIMDIYQIMQKIINKHNGVE